MRTVYTSEIIEVPLYCNVVTCSLRVSKRLKFCVFSSLVYIDAHLCNMYSQTAESLDAHVVFVDNGFTEEVGDEFE